MTFAGRFWWQEVAPKIIAGLLILAGMLLMLTAQFIANPYAGWGLIAGLILVALGAVTIVVIKRNAWSA